MGRKTQEIGEKSMVELLTLKLDVSSCIFTIFADLEAGALYTLLGQCRPVVSYGGWDIAGLVSACQWKVLSCLV
jgi:hypothetical protein